MTPIEKAKQLFDRYNECNKAIGSYITPFQVKQCAFIAVDEIKRVCPYIDHLRAKAFPETSDEYDADQTAFISYWQKVKEEIDRL